MVVWSVILLRSFQWDTALPDTPNDPLFLFALLSGICCKLSNLSTATILRAIRAYPAGLWWRGRSWLLRWFWKPLPVRWLCCAASFRCPKTPPSTNNGPGCTNRTAQPQHNARSVFWRGRYWLPFAHVSPYLGLYNGPQCSFDHGKPSTALLTIVVEVPEEKVFRVFKCCS